MKNVLITGSNRGIGLGLIKYLLKQNNASSSIFATCRNPFQAEELQEVAKTNKHLHIFQLDVKDFNNYDNLVNQVTNVVGTDGLNVLFNNAGISSKFTRVNLVKVDQMIDNYLINTVGPLMLAKAFIPLLKKASTANSAAPVGMSRAAIINVSSILGSIAKNNQGGFYPYRTSKAGLNAVTRSLSLDLKDEKILVVSLHPGWIKTGLGGPQAPLEVDSTVPIILDTLNRLTEKHTGGFYQYDGKELPW